jgi:hypothetical protein
MQLTGQSNKFFLQVKAAIRHFKVLGTCGGCDSFLIFHHFLKNKYGFATMLPQAMLLTERSEIAK